MNQRSRVACFVFLVVVGAILAAQLVGCRNSSSEKDPDDAAQTTPKNGTADSTAKGTGAGGTSTASDITKTPEKDLTPPRKAYRDAIVALQGNSPNYSLAKSKFYESLDLDPKQKDVRNDFVRMLIMTNNAMEACQVTAEGIKALPDDPDSYNNHGATLARANDTEGAIENFRKAIELKSDHDGAHFNLGLTLATQGKTDEAIEEFGKVIELQPGNVDARFQRARLLARMGTEKADKAAETDFKEVNRLKNDFTPAHFQLGQLREKQGKYPEAISAYNEVLRNSPYEADAHFAIAMALAAMGKYDAAVPHLIEVVRSKPEHADAHFKLAAFLVRQGKYEQAIAQNYDALSLRRDWPEALNNLAWIFATHPDEKIRNPDAALQIAQRARLLADAKMPIVLDTLAAAQANAGDFDGAIETATRAVELAKATKQNDLAKRIAERLELYKAGKPYREETPKESE